MALWTPNLKSGSVWVVEKPSKSSWRDLIRLRRLVQDRSAAELSRALSLSPSYISKVESGVLQPTVAIFAKLCRELELSDFEIAFLLKMIEKECDGD